MKGKVFKKYLFLLLALCSIMLVPSKISSGKTATTYDISKQDIIIRKSGSYVITGTTDKHTIQVTKGVSATITLKDVTITYSGDDLKPQELLDIKSGATVNLILAGTNTLSNENWGSAIHVPMKAKLTISSKDKGSLKAIAKFSGAGIGASGNDAAGETGTIIIESGTIYAEGSYDSCGIGGGATQRYDYTIYKNDYTGGGDITINGGVVTAIGGSDGGAAGIGGASLTRQGKITITGGTVTASSKEAGIGGESKQGKGNKITISGGTVIATGENYAAGIGNSMNPTGTSVTISGGTVTANGDYGSRTLYESYVGNSLASRTALKAYDVAAEKIEINGGNIMAYTFNNQPVNKEGKSVSQSFINCKKSKVSSIKVNESSYGAKDIVSNGYLSLYLPNEYQTITVKSGNLTLFNSFISFRENAVQGIERTKNLKVDLSKGTLELVDGGCIYNNTVYNCNNIIIAGKIGKNQLIVHNNKYQIQNITFDNIAVDYKTSGAQDFLIIDNDVTLNVHLKGKNSFSLGDKVRGIFVGHDATLCFTGDETADSFTINTGEESSAIYTNLGNVVQYGAFLDFKLGSNSAAINTGNYGTFTLCGGKFEAHSEKGSNINGLSSMRITINGGTFLADNIGVYETGNEEISNRTYFVMTGGNVEITNRIIFADYKIYGGNLKAKILGCGSGCDVTMYQGNLEIGTYFDSKDGTLETDIKNENILGGTIKQRNDVPKEELDMIITFLC